MLDFLNEHRVLAGQLVLASILVALVYLGLVFIFIARMSPDYFASPKPSRDSWRTRHPAVRLAVRVIKNLLGLVFLVAGVAMLVLPGQGALTILVAVTLLDFPGKRRFELRIMRQRHVRKSVNWIRRKAGRPELILPDPDDEPKAG